MSRAYQAHREAEPRGFKIGVEAAVQRVLDTAKTRAAQSARDLDVLLARDRVA
jgi:hypothetical protein